jgi:RNA polymerase sigma factor (TIGR02999 family)
VTTAGESDALALTRLIELSRAGDPAALDKLLAAVYDDLRDIAARHMYSERPDHTLQPTALVHEAFLRLSSARDLSFTDRNHYMRAASLAMRRVLVDYARARNAAKRESSLRVTLEDSVAVQPGDVDILDLSDALERLRAAEPRCAEIVELRFFAGLEVPEVAEVLDISAATVKRDWRFAKAWLARELGASAPTGDS